MSPIAVSGPNGLRHRFHTTDRSNPPIYRKLDLALPQCARATHGRSRELSLRTVCIRPTPLRPPLRWWRRLVPPRSPHCAAGRRPPTTPQPLAAIPVPPEVWSSRHLTDPPYTAGNVHCSCSCHELLVEKVDNRPSYVVLPQADSQSVCLPPTGGYNGSTSGGQLSRRAWSWARPVSGYVPPPLHGCQLLRARY